MSGHPLRKSSATLEELMEQLAHGDRQAFGPIFTALWAPCLRYAQHLLGGASSAEDATQRALVRLFEEAPSYRPGRPVLAWALSLAYWEARTERQKRVRNRTEPLGSHDFASSDPSVLDQLIDQEALSELSTLIQALAPPERLLLGLDDDALLQHVAPSTIRKRKQRLLVRLRRALYDLAQIEDEND